MSNTHLGHYHGLQALALITLSWNSELFSSAGAKFKLEAPRHPWQSLM